MSPVEPARHESGRERDDHDTEEVEAEVIAFPGAGPSGAGAPVEVTETEPEADPEGEVLEGEIVDEPTARRELARAPGADVVPFDEAGPTPAQIVYAYWRRTRPALRPDRLAWSIVRHELYYGGRGLA
ncbi:hypothetical protein, partial [Nocardiopsis halophila]|uniref:hypothetical protein n=1 Tax=Nocardiopsis halophila TaxID=141692 RepID=UPI0005846942